MFFNRSSQRSRSLKSKRSSTSLRGVTRRACFEPLESRNLLSVTLPTIANQTVMAGAPLNLALASTGTTNPVSYTVSVSNSNVTGTVPTGNTFLKLHVHDTTDGIDGDLVFELFNDLAPNTVTKITSLVTSGFYNNLTFHRIIKDFMIQGGDPSGDGTGGPNLKFDDEFNVNSQFTSTGLLAMANSGSDTNDSQFFITTAQTRWLDFEHTIFGKLVEGNSILNQLNAVPTGTNDKPTNSVTITSATIVTNTLDGVLRLSSPIGTTGTSVVTVTATDTITNETSEQQFTVTVTADSTNDPPFLNTISPIQTPVGTPVIFNIPATDAEGDAIYYDYDTTNTSANLTVSVNHSTGSVTITPASSLAPGVYSVRLLVARSSTYDLTKNSEYDSQVVPVYINPAAPTSIQLLADFDKGGSNTDGVTNLNNSSANTLQFQVNGVLPGALVQLFADGTLMIGEGTVAASGNSIVITTNGTVTLTDGSHAITAKQTLKNKAVSVGNLTTTTDLASVASSSLSVVVDTVVPQISFTPIPTASNDNPYNCLAGATDNRTGAITYSLTQSPTGMSVNPNTGLITWAPTSQTTPVQVTVKATDLAGNSSEYSYEIDIVAPNTAPVLTVATPSLGSITEKSNAIVKSLASFINNGTGTTQITDADSTAVIGGIALTGITGNGTWEYTLDGTTYQPITTVSDSSALLLAHDASLRFTPDGKNGGPATITYRAWDTTAGTSGGRINISLPVLVDGITAFSGFVDTASLTVTDVNDAPVLTPAPANPSMGSTDFHQPKIISLTGTFINNGTGTTIITDVDNNAIIGGIALIGYTGSGTWAYSLDGTTFTAVGTVSNAAALLLPKEAKLRYTPNNTNTETATIIYSAWDKTSGASGDKVDLSGIGAIGGSTAFSSLTDTASLSVTDDNDAPVLTPASPSLGTTTEETAFTINLTDTFINHGANTTTITDADSTAVIGGIALISVTGSGKWEYSPDGTTWFTISNVSDSSALLLIKTATLRYTPDNKNGETATLVYRAWDTTSGSPSGRVDLSLTSSRGGTSGFSTATDTASLTVTSVNDAPVLVAANPSMGSIAPNGVKTISLTGTFINFNSGSTTITDADTSADVGGIALIGITGSGTWEYSTNGTTFTAVETISASSALLLPKTATLRYTAGSSLTDTPSITYRAWDTTTGTSGVKVDLSASSAFGGTTAFSTVTDTATLAIAGGSLSGFVYFDLNNDGSRVASNGSTEWGIAGVPVKLLQYSSGTWSEVAGQSPVLTASDGSFHFNNLGAGTYRVQEIQPTNYLDGVDTAGKIGGVVKGTVGSDTIEIQLSAGETGTEYNFGEKGLQPKKITLKLFLASTPRDARMLSYIDVQSVVNLSASNPGTGYAALLPAAGTSVNIAASDAIITDTDSSLLAGMAVRIINPYGGNIENLSATVTNTPITANYANGVLTLSGVADAATYTQVLKTIQYSNSATSTTPTSRKLEIVVNDGVSDSLHATTLLAATADELAAADSLFRLGSDWLSN